jgi:hypothetical protein
MNNCDVLFTGLIKITFLPTAGKRHDNKQQGDYFDYLKTHAILPGLDLLPIT